MVIEIENTSSPGASFTENTNLVLLKTYEWICDHKELFLSFKEFRMKLQQEKGINDNNNRNIYPLLKNGGLADYEKRKNLQVDRFFTNTGLAYVKILETIRLVENEGYTEKQVVEVRKRFDEVQREIIFGALQKIVNKPAINYVEPFRDMIKFLLKFGKISKVEFAYLVYMKQQQKVVEKALISMHSQIDMYRDGDLKIDVQVKVRNDAKFREEMTADRRKEGLTFLTSYGYFTSLLQQAGLIRKVDDKYYAVIEEKRSRLEQLGGI